MSSSQTFSSTAAGTPGLRQVVPLERSRAGKRTGAIIGASVLAAIVAYAVFVPLLAGTDQKLTDFSSARLPPSSAHLFGTDHAGRDLFVRLASGLRISLIIASLCAVLAMVLGLLVGAVSAALGGRADRIIMRCIDGVNAVPHLLLGVVIVAMFRGSVTAIIASIALTHWTQVARIVRSEVLSLRSLEYVEASYLLGATRGQVLWRHFLPGALGQGIVATVMLLPHAIWHESTLSFLGLGLSPDRASLGTLLQEAQAEVMLGGWWALLFPALLLVCTTLAIAACGAGLVSRTGGRS
ncbi:ABC transporter permease [Arthrobacter gengyunqii]|uniref:ABC transporter permease n=1 Tax=Arthrobacter gengyunqii TaxID=2886940 RepID=A0A9X1S761_9MICC|nr:ABC transporter permease [Arthrobacter gengyunqii]MCC3269712.1 ABC transporter permease [Arthrobacter gengyunqii]UOY97167.1 ABC transporter permease [Arthrobacter gengyunqii]